MNYVFFNLLVRELADNRILILSFFLTRLIYSKTELLESMRIELFVLGLRVFQV
jgi:hypothetical protein